MSEPENSREGGSATSQAKARMEERAKVRRYAPSPEELDQAGEVATNVLNALDLNEKTLFSVAVGVVSRTANQSEDPARFVSDLRCALERMDEAYFDGLREHLNREGFAE